ncbi:cytochrome P450 [Suillus subalutaceus]|uniref:cytochrome P450 n=1 Tax=Suillus subalutaceus TaxID=48586 RepID=UPI001B863069|nr:cytochrome P450 [Suillus subalutaceus]KAG1836042.1 cytochrome P450 [Suillus subalutaceus]
MALTGGLLLAGLALLAYFRLTRPPFPPGPNPLPIIGNILDLTPKELWLTAFKWAHTYGPITHIRIFNQSLVFLNTPKAVFDLLDKRGSIYSDKPHLVMAGELCGCENMAAFTPYGDRARRQRKLMQKAYHGLMQMESRPFLSRLVSSPLQFQDHIRRYAGGLTLLVVYGHQVKSNDDPFLNLAEECVDILANRIASGGGIWPVDVFPALKHLPTWFPGASFKCNAKIWKAKMEEFVDLPYEFVKSEIKKGTARPSFVSTLLEPPKLSSPFDASFDSTTTDDNDDEASFTSSSDRGSSFSSDNTKDTATDDHDIRWTANSMYSASIDTTITTLSHFILAMVQHPHVLRRAQAELDDVLGSGESGLPSKAKRLPTFEDRSNLPYCDAVFTETLRWGVPVPLNLPHRLTQPDTYEGMYIPQGSLVFGNIWAIMRDPALYQDPEVFEPGRWLARDAIVDMEGRRDLDVGVEEEAGNERDPRAFVFGFGRRRCPGTHLVESSVWLLITGMLATLDIRKARDERGVEIEPVVRFENSVFRTPSPFMCDIRPRSEEALKLIMEGE